MRTVYGPPMTPSFRPAPERRETGFSLVELAIVLVVLGLLVGGVLAGQSLIRAAQERTLIRWHTDMHGKFHTFRDKYMGWPGDLPNATLFWGRSTTLGCTSDPGEAKADGTCNGNGDGFVGWYGENLRVPHHLYLAGLDNTSPRPNGSTPYWNTPTLERGTLSYVGGTEPRAELYAWSGRNGIALQTGRQNLTNGALGGAVLPVERTWRMDTKIDDGMPLGGVFQARNAALQTDDAITVPCLTTATPPAYNLAETRIACQTSYLLVKR